MRSRHLVLSVAVGLIALCVPLGLVAGWRGFVANTSWTVAFLTAAWLAWQGYRAVGQAQPGGADGSSGLRGVVGLGRSPAGHELRPMRRAFAYGLLAYALGQIFFLTQVVLETQLSPAPSDLLFLLLGPCMIWGFLRGLWQGSQLERTAVLLDGLAIGVAVATAVLAVYVARIDERPDHELLVMAAYPVLFLSATAIGATLLLARGCSWSLRGPAVLLLGLLGSSLAWIVFNERFFAGGDPYEPILAAVFSLTVLLMGWGVGRWELVPSSSLIGQRLSFLILRLLPLLLVVLAMAALAWGQHEEALVETLISTGALIVVGVAIVRQSLVVLDRDHVLNVEAGLAASRAEQDVLTKRLREAERLEAIGRLSGGIAHDFNNLLTIILGHADLARRHLAEGTPLLAHVDAMAAAGERGAALVRQLLGFARRQFAEPQPTDLNVLIGEIDTMLRRTLGEHLHLAIVPSPEAVVTLVDPGQAVQVVLNLAGNARDAMPEGGQLTIEVQRVELDASYAAQRSEVKPGSYGLIAVTDTGMGIPPEDLPKVFEPFFTTKSRGAGTGLGLASCHGIVKQHGGHIAIYSEPGRGTTVKVYLPISSEQPVPTPRRGVRKVLGAGRCILLCEDDNGIRTLAARVLTEAGFIVLEAGDGQDGLEVAAAHEGRIDLLMTDVVMPRLGGTKLAEQLRQLRPDLRVLFVSGYTENAVVHQGILKPGVQLLQKPFTAEDLLQRAVEVLESDPSSASRAARPAVDG